MGLELNYKYANSDNDTEIILVLESKPEIL